MTINQFISAYKVKPADAIVVKKENFGILNHYVIYLGVDVNGEHKFIANYTQGVRIIPTSKLIDFLKSYIPIQINKFVGSDEQRAFAVRRALSRMNEHAYNLILNNCEHFANWVQKGLPKSDQVEDFGKGIALAGLGAGVIGLTSKNKEIAIIGSIAAVLGLFFMGLEQDR